MKSRLIWTAVLVAAIAGFYYATIRLDRALRDIAEATKEVTFPPRK